MKHSKEQNRPGPTTKQLVQVIQTLQPEVQTLQGGQAELEAAASTLATASVAGDAASYRDHKAGMKPPRPANFNSKRKCDNTWQELGLSGLQLGLKVLLIKKTAWLDFRDKNNMGYLT